MAERKPANVGAIAKYLSDLMGRDVEAKAVAAMDDVGGGAVVASYTDDNGGVEALCVCDVGAAASLAAALSLVGPAQVQDAAKAQKIDGVLRENFHEVCNILGRLVSESTSGIDTEQLRLRELSDVADAPEDVATLLGAPAARVDTNISVQGYSGGYLALLTQ